MEKRKQKSFSDFLRVVVVVVGQKKKKKVKSFGEEVSMRVDHVNCR
jgi:hypothetical protein